MPLPIGGKAVLNQLIEKQKKLQKTSPATKKGGSLIVRIQNICEQVQTKLGHYSTQLELIQTKERLHEYIDKAIEQDIISIDTETTGLDPITSQIVGACIYTRGEKAAYIPINHISYLTSKRLDGQLTEKEVAEEFQRLIDAKTKAIFFNAKFDIRVMRWQLGVFFEPAHCGFIAGKCLKEDEPEGNLKFLWKKYCCPPDFEEPALTFDKMFEGICFNLIPLSTAYLYAAKDALMTLELYDFQIQYLDENNPKCQEAGLQRVAKLYREIELPIITIVADIEDQGVVIDTEYAKKLSLEYNQKLKDAEQKFLKELSKYQDQITSYVNNHPDTKLENPVNINSPVQIAELFYDVLKVPPVSKKDPKGTGKDILKAMGHPLCAPILEYKNIAKLVSTYIDALPQLINKRTGRLHCNFNQYGAATGRFSCIAKGTPIKLVGEEKPIEEVKVGDLVYCYDDEGKLRIRKVKWVKDIGDRDCVDIKWQSSGTGRIGHLICTPNHEIKTKHKGWVCAKDLKRYDKMYHLTAHIQKNGRVRFMGTNKYDELEEQCIKREYFNADSKMHIHHIDENKSNNKIENLRVMTHSEHCSFHSKERYEKGEIKSEWMLKNRPKLKFGKEHPMYKDVSLEELKQMIHNVKGNIREVPLDFDTFKKKCKEYNFDYKEIAAKYNKRYIKLTRENVINALDKCGGKITKAHKLLGVGYIAFHKFCVQENIEYNHMVQAVTPCGKRHVYDIEVEDFHNFIANEICVHNSSNPNFQNLPSKNHDIRLMFMAAKESIVECKDNKLDLYIEDLVPTTNGDKNSQDLQIGDVIICDDGKYSVKDIKVEDVFVTVIIERIGG